MSPNPLTSDPTHHSYTNPATLHATFRGDFAKTYHLRTGGCNISLANHLISLVRPHLPPSPSPLHILDNACGPLVLTTQLLTDASITNPSCPRLHISAVDLSPDFIASNQRLIDHTPAWKCVSGGKAVVDTAVMDGMDLKFPDNTFDLSFTSLALFAFPDPVRGVAEIYRTLKSGGVAAVTTWKRLGSMALLHAAEDVIRPGKAKTRFLFLEPWQVRGKLEGTLREGGFEDVFEGEAVVQAWWEGEGEAAAWLSQTLRSMVGEEWTEGEKQGMEEGLLRVLREGKEIVGVLREEDSGRVGFEMVAWTGVGRK